MTEVRLKKDAFVTFKKELEYLEDESLRGFFVNAINVAPESFHDDEEIQMVSKRAYHVLRGFMDARDIKGALRDALLGTTLICDIMHNEMAEGLEALHPVAVRQYLIQKGADKLVVRQLWENIMRAVEAHEGQNGPSPILDAKPGTAEFEVVQAFNVAKMDYIDINWEAI